MLILHGVQHKSGTYEGRPYDNVVLHCLDDTPPSSPTSQLLGGSICDIFKVSVLNIPHTFSGLVASPADLVAMIGQGLTVAYDRYGRPDTITFLVKERKGV